MGKRLPRVRVDDEDGRDFEIEEGAWDAIYAMLNVDALRGIPLTAVFKVPLKLRGAVLVGVDNLAI